MERPFIGPLKAGGRDSITDVPGVRVGHCTLADGDLQTGITVVLPHGDDLYRLRPRAASVVLNGFGKSVGLMQVAELGVLESPIALTNTLSVGTVAQAQIRATCRANPEVGRGQPTGNVAVLECNDGYLNDIQAMVIEARHYDEAVASAGVDFARGAVGAGRGTSMFGLKGGIGSASRIAGDTGYVLGALVQTNFGLAPNLILDGQRIGPEVERRLKAKERVEELGSIIMVLATNAPLDDRQLRRLALRAGAGLARTGSFFGHGSGDVVVAFTTANPIPHDARDLLPAAAMLPDARMNPLFQSAADATEQAIVDALFSAETVRGFRGHVRYGFREIMQP